MTAPRRTGIPAVPPIEQPDLHSFLIAIRKVLERLEGVVSTLDTDTTASDASIASDLSSLSDDVAALIADLASTSASKGASLIGIQDSGALITATTVEGALAENRAAIDALESNRALKAQTSRICFQFPYPEDGDYIFRAPFPFGATITGVYSYTHSTGSVTITPKLSGVAITGGAVTPSNFNVDDDTPTANNVANAADYLWLTLSSTTSDCENVSVTLEYTETIS